MIAFFRAGVPSTAVYLVKPSSMALRAAALMCSGVSKSGSPAPRPITSLPAARISAARVVTARVGEGLMACTRAESLLMGMRVLQGSRVAAKGYNDIQTRPRPVSR